MPPPSLSSMEGKVSLAELCCSLGRKKLPENLDSVGMRMDSPWAICHQLQASALPLLQGLWLVGAEESITSDLTETLRKAGAS